MKNTEGAFRDWGYKLAQSKFRSQVVTERESWILGNKDKDAAMSVEANAKSIDPGYDMMTPAQQQKLRDEVDGVIKSVRARYQRSYARVAHSFRVFHAQLHASHGGGKYKKMLMIKDSIADITLQQVLTRPKEFDVIATLNLNGDYLSDALAAQVGGIGIAPGVSALVSCYCSCCA